MERTSEEIWKPVEGFPNAEVSNCGRVRSLFRGGCDVRKQWVNENGYAVLHLQNKRVKKSPRVHVLVAHAFIGPKPDGMDVNHIDGVKLNNHAGNLEYISRSENLKHAFRLGLASTPFKERGERHHHAKVSNAAVLDIQEAYTAGESRSSIAARYGISYYTVWDYTSGRGRAKAQP